VRRGPLTISRRGALIAVVAVVSLAVLALVTGLGLAARVDPTRPGPAAAPPVASCSGMLAVSASPALELPYCSNRSLSTPDPGIRRLVVVIHGDARNAADYLDAMQASADASDAGDTLIVAPQFWTADDDGASTSRDALYFTSGGWKAGDPSEVAPLPRSGAVSSFAALDALILAVASGGAFPNLRLVVVTGHSAGGQLVDRYAATSAVEDQLPDLAFRYVIANPSSYLYFDARRPDGAGEGFAEPTRRDVRDCRALNAWKYGLEDLNPYAAAVGPAAILDRYGHRHITYLLGGKDSDPEDASLDTSCAGEWQGSGRLERGRLHFTYLGTVFGDEVYATHDLAVVPGVGHDAAAMYLSSAARAAIFDAEAGPPAVAPSR
jgi:hypothetical protein